jgi:hypothetical protein
MPVEKGGDALNDSRRVDPGLGQRRISNVTVPLRLALEIFHYVEEAIVDVRLVHKTNLDLVQIAKRILMTCQYEELRTRGQLIKTKKKVYSHLG